MVTDEMIEIIAQEMKRFSEMLQTSNAKGNMQSMDGSIVIPSI